MPSSRALALAYGSSTEIATGLVGVAELSAASHMAAAASPFASAAASVAALIGRGIVTEGVL